jgi:hypothetical protein
MTIKQNTPVAAAMGVFAFGEALPSVDSPETDLPRSIRASSRWAQGARGRVHQASPTATVDPVAYRRCPTRRCLFMPHTGPSFDSE